jgi:hypothetical protein
VRKFFSLFTPLSHLALHNFQSLLTFFANKYVFRPNRRAEILIHIKIILQSKGNEVKNNSMIYKYAKNDKKREE